MKNLFGSLLVIVDQPFSVGDYFKVGSVDGTIEELGFRSTRIRTPENSLVTLPNSNLITSAVDNLGARPYRRWKMSLGLTYDTPPEKIEAFCEGIRELIRNHPQTRKEAYYVYFNQFSASSLDVLVQLHFDVPGYEAELIAKQELGLDFLRLAEKLGVEMAYPTQTVHVHGGGGRIDLLKIFKNRLDQVNPPATGRRWLYVPYDQLSDGIGPLAQEAARGARRGAGREPLEGGPGAPTTARSWRRCSPTSATSPSSRRGGGWRCATCSPTGPTARPSSR